MTPSKKLARARNSVHAFCQEQFPGETTQLRDSIVICEGFYRGRRFHGEKVTAVWFAEEDQLKIHSTEGECLASWDAAEMEQQLQRGEPTTLPIALVEDEASHHEPTRRAA